MRITNYKGREILARVTDSYQHKGKMLVTVGVSRKGGSYNAGIACGFEDTCDLEAVPQVIQELQETAARWIDENG